MTWGNPYDILWILQRKGLLYESKNYIYMLASRFGRQFCCLRYDSARNHTRGDYACRNDTRDDYACRNDTRDNHACSNHTCSNYTCSDDTCSNHTYSNNSCSNDACSNNSCRATANF